MKIKYVWFFVLFFLFFSCNKGSNSSIYQTTNYSETDYSIGSMDPLANPDAKIGGIIKTWGATFPKSLNYWLDVSSFNGAIAGLLFDSLLQLHSLKDEYVGILAESWEMSTDKKTFTFTIRPEAHWSDGKPISSDDFVFFYDTIMNVSNMTAVHRSSLKKLQRPIIINDKKFSITAIENHWGNFQEAANLMPFPKHVWEGKDFNKIKFEFPVVCGPYSIKNVKQNRSLEIIRNQNWWGKKLAYNKFKYNFDGFLYRFMDDRVKALQAFQKADFDVYAIYTSSIWNEQTSFPAVEKGWVLREKIYNKNPISFQGLAINLRQERFKDLKVRRALAYLLDRQKMNDKFMYNQYFLLNTYFPDLYPNNINPNAEQFSYNEEKARKLLAEAGYEINAEGKLEKKGLPFSLTFMTASPDTRHLSLYVESLKKVGIEAKIEQLSGATIGQRMDNYEYGIYWMAWGAGRLKDPEVQWQGDQVLLPGGFNIPGYSNEKVDQLIKLQKTEYNIEKRNQILKEIDKILVAELPYILLWQNDHSRLLSWNIFGYPKNKLGKYYDESAINAYWWYDSELADKTMMAKKNNVDLGKIDRSLYYEELHP